MYKQHISRLAFRTTEKNAFQILGNGHALHMIVQMSDKRKGTNSVESVVQHEKNGHFVRDSCHLMVSIASNMTSVR